MSTKYPEHEKLQAIAMLSQAVGEFLDWAGEKGMVLAVWEPRQKRMVSGRFGHNRIEQRMYPAQASTRQLLAEFFDIDEAKIEAEKRAMLDEIRSKS